MTTDEKLNTILTELVQLRAQVAQLTPPKLRHTIAQDIAAVRVQGGSLANHLKAKAKGKKR